MTSKACAPIRWDEREAAAYLYARRLPGTMPLQAGYCGRVARSQVYWTLIGAGQRAVARAAYRPSALRRLLAVVGL